MPGPAADSPQILYFPDFPPSMPFGSIDLGRGYRGFALLTPFFSIFRSKGTPRKGFIGLISDLLLGIIFRLAFAPPSPPPPLRPRCPVSKTSRSASDPARITTEIAGSLIAGGDVRFRMFDATVHKYSNDCHKKREAAAISQTRGAKEREKKRPLFQKIDDR